MKKFYLWMIIVPMVLLSACSDDKDDPRFQIIYSNIKAISYESTADFYFDAYRIDEVRVTDKPEGWDACVYESFVRVTAPARDDASAERKGKITLVAYRGSNAFSSEQIPVECGLICGFDNVPNIDQYVAGPTAYGENLYADYTGASPALFTQYTDEETKLTMGINDDGFSGDRNFWNGGIAISKWWNMFDASIMTNQCSSYNVYNSPGIYSVVPPGVVVCPEPPTPGYKSYYYATGYYSSYSDQGPELTFSDGSENVIDHMWVTNSTCAYLAMKDGNSTAKKFEAGDWFKITIEGFNAGGTSMGTKDFYLADFRPGSEMIIIPGWTKVDLSGLGEVNKITIKMSSSDVGVYGINTPTYVCIDDIVVI